MNPKPKMVDDRTVLTGLFTLSFPQIAKPKRFKDRPTDPLKYSVRCLIEKGSDTEAALRKAAHNAMAANGQDPEVTEIKIQDGDGPKCKKFKGHEGMIFINPSSNGEGEYSDRPNCYIGGRVLSESQAKKRNATDEELKAMTAEIAKTFYAGARCRAEVYAHTYDGGVTFLLNAIQFCEDGERLGGRTSSGNEFDDDYSGQFAENEEPSSPFQNDDDIPFQNDDDIPF